LSVLELWLLLRENCALRKTRRAKHFDLPDWEICMLDDQLLRQLHECGGHSLFCLRWCPDAQEWYFLLQRLFLRCTNGGKIDQASTRSVTPHFGHWTTARTALVFGKVCCAKKAPTRLSLI
jgi:hypothetical protein